MNSDAQTLIDALQLQPHPEGGYYREIFRSSQMVAADQDRGGRAALTTIYFLLESGHHSRWHRVLSDEVWSYLEGDPLELFCFDVDSSLLLVSKLGPYAPETEPTHVVPAGIWQAARSLGEYTLVGCTVGPGFEFQDFSMAVDHPDVAEAIRKEGEQAAKLV
jgi:predicted cupin superfamily sugar epimerase